MKVQELKVDKQFDNTRNSSDSEKVSNIDRHILNSSVVNNIDKGRSYSIQRLEGLTLQSTKNGHMITTFNNFKMSVDPNKEFD